jgi:hypothetical protein
VSARIEPKPLHARLERAGRILQDRHETCAAEDCYKAADVLRRAERQIVKLLAYVQKLEKR